MLPWSSPFRRDAARRLVDERMRYRADWRALGRHLASDDWLVKTWPQVEGGLVDRLGRVASWHGSQHRVVVVRGGRLVNVGGAEVRSGEVLPPTGDGWRVFLGPGGGGGRLDPPERGRGVVVGDEGVEWVMALAADETSLGTVGVVFIVGLNALGPFDMSTGTLGSLGPEGPGIVGVQGEL